MGQEFEMSLQARAGGLALEMDEALRGTVTLGWLEADGLNGEPLGDAYTVERDDAIRALLRRFTGRPAADIPGVAETRGMFHRLGVDPTKSRPASEALLRRVLQGKGLPLIHPAVDVCNLASLEHQLPLGLYDRAHVKGAIYARVGRPAEGYEGIRRGRVNLTGRVLLADDDGPFGAPTADSARTQVTAGTRAVLAVIYCPTERPSEHLSAMLARVADLLSRHCGATVHLVQTRQ
jgi:DNA/RNA-binding domain of Phe-tRNA-synthetase-like protein